MAPRHALQFHDDSLETYWRQPVEPARLYPSNPNIRNTHGRCLARETDLNGTERALPSPKDTWPEQLPPTLREIARGDHYAPEFQAGDPQQPHRNDIRDAADGRARIVQILPEGETELLTSELTRREAARDAYPLATYLHAKQSYSILGWRETRGETVITARHAPQQETRPITRSGATLTLQQPRVSGLGHLEYCTHAQAVAWERIVGCAVREPGDGEWREVPYGGEGIPEVMTSLRTTATLIIVWEDWFDDANTRRDVARVLRTVMCGRESIHPADIRTTHQNIQVVRDGRSSEVSRASARGRNGCCGRMPRKRCTGGPPTWRPRPWVPSTPPSSPSTPVRPSAASWRPGGRHSSMNAGLPGSTSRSGSAAGRPISGSCWTVPRPTSR